MCGGLTVAVSYVSTDETEAGDASQCGMLAEKENRPVVPAC